jgi:TRIAD3 protein (E3 ubiquitin-protein ligase RNF216)
VALLQNEFLEIPVKHITKVLKQQTTLFKAYRVLEVQARSYQQGVSPFVNIKKPRSKRDIKLILPELRSNMVKELHAAKNKSEIEASKFNMCFLEVLLFTC